MQFLAKAAADYLGVLRAIAPTAARVTDKMPVQLPLGRADPRGIPRATIIHCRRAAIDTALSIHQTHFRRAWRFDWRRRTGRVFPQLPALIDPLAERAAGGALHRG